LKDKAAPGMGEVQPKKKDSVLKQRNVENGCHASSPFGRPARKEGKRSRKKKGGDPWWGLFKEELVKKKRAGRKIVKRGEAVSKEERHMKTAEENVG